MTPRRPPGTGSKTQLPDGRYQVSVEAGWTKRGTRRRIRRNTKASGRAGEREANQLLQQLLREVSPDESVRQAMTVKGWSEAWLEITKARLRPSTWATNRSAVNRWIVPTVGHRRLDKLTPSDVRSVSREVVAAGLSPATAQRHHLLLVKMLRDAMVEGYAVGPRLLEMEAPERGENDRDAIPLLHARKILTVAQTRLDFSRWLAAFIQGVRPAEARGLTWDRVDLDAGLMDISWQLKPLPYNEPRNPESGFRIPVGYTAKRLEHAYHLVRPKTAKGKRIIPIVPAMAAELRRWREAGPRSPYGLVWPEPDGAPLYEKHDRKAWRAICAAAGVGPYDLYEARHTTATILLSEGVDMEIIKAILGHSSILSTAAYAHVRTDTARAALERVPAALGVGGDE